MPKKQSPIGEKGTLLRAIDGSHLQWSEFRTNVLNSFSIEFCAPVQASDLPAPILEELLPCFVELDRFDIQRAQWHAQLEEGQGFQSSMIFPPSLLPSTADPLLVHRGHVPRMTREALPLRNMGANETLFELPTPKPGLVTGFTTQAFAEEELGRLPNCVNTTVTVVNFDAGTVCAGTEMYCPFMIFERIHDASEEAIEKARNQCAIAGAQCVRSMQLLCRRLYGSITQAQSPSVFSCCLDNTRAIINYHHVSENGKYTLSEVCRFDLRDDHEFNHFQAWLEGIEGWAVSRLLPSIKEALTRKVINEPLTPQSPLPSLTLSIDTTAGGDEVILKLLRATYTSIKWRSDGDEDTPIHSSIALCGTPSNTRKLRIATMSPDSARSPKSAWRTRPGWGSRSPRSRRQPLSPVIARSESPVSPCRPPTLTPCTPLPEAPWSAQSPMLVLQRRMDLAMDEIQELRKIVGVLQGELQKKTEESKKLRLQTLLPPNLGRVLTDDGATPIAAAKVPFKDLEWTLPTSPLSQMKPAEAFATISNGLSANDNGPAITITAPTPNQIIPPLDLAIVESKVDVAMATVPQLTQEKQSALNVGFLFWMYLLLLVMAATCTFFFNGPIISDVLAYSSSHLESCRDHLMVSGMELRRTALSYLHDSNTYLPGIIKR